MRKINLNPAHIWHQIERKVPDETWVKRAQAGNKHAFEVLYMKYLDPIYRYVYFKTGQDIELAEDITSIAFVKAWSKFSSFDIKRGTFQAWIYQIARNSVVDHFRTNKSTTSIDQVSQSALSDNSQAETLILEGLSTKSLNKALKHLTPEQIEIIELKFIEGLSTKQVATITGKKHDAIRALQSRAIKTLRTVMEIYD